MFIKIHRNEQGLSLVELLIVITILGVAASVAIPDISTSNVSRIEMAATEVANAMRFARSEAMRTGQPHGFRQTSTQKRIRVFSLDASSPSPWTLSYNVYHPLSKKLYDVDLDDYSFTSVDGMGHSGAFWAGCSSSGKAYFDANGIPWCTNPETILLKQFKVNLTLGNHTRVVTLHGITGRVTINE